MIQITQYIRVTVSVSFFIEINTGIINMFLKSKRKGNLLGKLFQKNEKILFLEN